MGYNRLGCRNVAARVVIQAVKDVAKRPDSVEGKSALKFLHSQWCMDICDCCPSLKSILDIDYVESCIDCNKNEYRKNFLQTYVMEMKSYRRRTLYYE